MEPTTLTVAQTEDQDLTAALMVDTEHSVALTELTIATVVPIMEEVRTTLK